MKYTIEIIRHEDDGTRKVLRRFVSDAYSPSVARAKAMILLQRAQEANGVRIIDHRRQEVYSWRGE